MLREQRMDWISPDHSSVCVLFCDSPIHRTDPLMRNLELIIVDDDDDVRLAVHLLVQEALPLAHITDHRLCLDALQQLESRGADLLITNCHMPDMDGPTLVRILREKKFSIPIIMISASDDARKLGQAAGIDRFIEKRFLDPDLAAAIHALLKRV